uniref:uncharacterized protein LOC120337349 n=1 Tax=Styela clava TaxID=7725 RepID=UPI00193AB8D6|nr:uncharacterized protein LOC120337349 [Styela clava]
MKMHGIFFCGLLFFSSCLLVTSVPLGIYVLDTRETATAEVTAIAVAIKSKVEEKLGRTFTQYDVQSYSSFFQDANMLAIHVKVADSPAKEFISFVVSDAYDASLRKVVTAIDGLSKNGKNNLSVMIVGRK